MPAGVRAIAPIDLQAATGITDVQLEPDRFTKYKTYGDTLAAYEKEPPIRVLFENGAGDKNNLGAPFGTYEMRLPSRGRRRNAVPTSWWFQPDQALSSEAADDLRRRRQRVDVVRLRPDREAGDRLPRLDLRHLGRASELRLARVAVRQGARVRQSGAQQDHGRRADRAASTSGSVPPRPTPISK